MKILVINWRDIKNPEAGGAESHLHEIFKRIAAKGHDVTLVSSKFKGCRISETIDKIHIIRKGTKFNFNFVMPIYYITELHNKEFDIVIDDISKIPICTPLYVKKPLIAIIHHVHGDTLFKELPFIMAFYVWISEKFLIRFYRNNTIVSVSESTKEELVGMNMPEKNIIIIHNGYQKGIITENKKSEYPLIIYVGRIKVYKQLDHLIEAFKTVRDCIHNSKLIIAGKGDKNYLKKIVLESDLNSSVQFYDEVSEEEKFYLLQKAWIFATPSMKEGWGITVIEANGCATPAIAYDVPGLRDSIKHGYNGMLAKEGDIGSLAKVMIDILKNEELRQTLSRNALQWSRRFSWDKNADLFLDLLFSELKNVVKS